MSSPLRQQLYSESMPSHCTVVRCLPPDHCGSFIYCITGSVAKSRIEPLLSWKPHNCCRCRPDPSRMDTTTGGSCSCSCSCSTNGTNSIPWIDYHSTDRNPEATMVHFLWENAPRHETKSYRDSVVVYSHLPYGRQILDNKWVLGRLLGTNGNSYNNNNYPSSKQDTTKCNKDLYLATLETHCFRGMDGYCAFAKQVGLLQNDCCTDGWTIPPIHETTTSSMPTPTYQFQDLIQSYNTHTKHNNHHHHHQWMTEPPPPSPNLWVVKDAHTNGAGGIWVVGSVNAVSMATISTTPLYNNHAYVAQQYVWPPVLYRQRKFHVRVYVVVTSHQQAYCHRRCFLHVANDNFVTSIYNNDNNSACYKDSVHITNCCANSHDTEKFLGEICADLEATDHVFTPIRKDATCSDENDTDATRPDHEITIGLAEFFPSIKASIAALAEATFPFLQGGKANCGFEYLGLDFILSYRNHSTGQQPVAYLLEVNAPPSQDTATGLPHAEDLHNEVLRDLLTLWVYPCVSGAAPVIGGWRCVYDDNDLERVDEDPILPSKAAILNKIRWTLFEKVQLSRSAKGKLVRSRTMRGSPTHPVANHARSFFSYFNEGRNEHDTSQPPSPPQIFFENAGGTQVPSQVVKAVADSLHFRHRAVTGAESVVNAKATLAVLLGASSDCYTIHLNSNATTLLATLAQRYIFSKLLQSHDEVVLCSQNHQANLQPWLDVANFVGVCVKWWDYPTNANEIERSLQEVLSIKTRIFAMPHASNILGTILDVQRIATIINQHTNGYCHTVVDGVAVAPHLYPSVDQLGVDWYIVSCHKLFGPHLGVLCGRKTIADQVCSNDEKLQLGTVNFEACEGVRGMGRYLMDLQSSFNTKTQDRDVLLTSSRVREAFRLIRQAESPLMDALLEGLRTSSKVRILESSVADNSLRIPLVSFVHAEIPSMQIVAACSNERVICRCGTFLSSFRFQNQYEINPEDGVVRFSLVHYNTTDEVQCALMVLRSIPKWF